ncbi:MAG: hypothetical protein M1827_004145 [Pycnora praestabilis]|nr:MAG: hypothetical protein M1827_004145 [Pycnora praestabilis]
MASPTPVRSPSNTKRSPLLLTKFPPSPPQSIFLETITTKFDTRNTYPTSLNPPCDRAREGCRSHQPHPFGTTGKEHQYSGTKPPSSKQPGAYHIPAASADTQQQSTSTARSSTRLTKPTSVSIPSPISIPTSTVHHRNTSTNTTPLTAREEKGGHYFPFHEDSPTPPPRFEIAPDDHDQEPRRRKTRPKLKMHNDRFSGSYRSSSPLSPTMSNSMLPPPSPIVKPRNNTPGLRLPTLPRFHPANFQAASSSSTDTPTSDSQPSLQSANQHGHQRHYSGAQRQLHMHQRELIANATRGRGAAMTGGVKPTSPKLLPLGSPGPVTPLMLEEEGGYLIAGAGSQGGNVLGEAGRRELVERMIHEEDQRRRDGQYERVTVVGGHR